MAARRQVDLATDQAELIWWQVDAAQSVAAIVQQNQCLTMNARKPLMKMKAQPITALYKAWLRSRLGVCDRDLQSIAAQRENDFHAERMLQRRMSEMRSKLQSLN